METAAFELYQTLRALTPVDLVSYGGTNKLLPVMYPALFVRSTLSSLRHKPDVIYLQDGTLAPFASPLRALTNSPVFATIHGLDLTFQNPLYQRLFVPKMHSVDRIVANSTNTANVVSSRLPGKLVDVVHYGVSDTFYSPTDRASLRSRFVNLVRSPLPTLSNSPVLATTGRLVRRKGVNWFIREVMPSIHHTFPDAVYLVTGVGPMHDEIERAISDNDLESSVFLLGRVSDEARDLLYNIADLFLMPNVVVPGDVEGFGLVATEASSCGTPVIGSNIQGIVDAISEGETGFKLPPEDAETWIKTLTKELKQPTLSRAAVRSKTLRQFSWQACANRYLALFRDEL
jgi:glycosyltransferase involved in cell wall biosynthesis